MNNTDSQSLFSAQEPLAEGIRNVPGTQPETNQSGNLVSKEGEQVSDTGANQDNSTRPQTPFFKRKGVRIALVSLPLLLVVILYILVLIKNGQSGARPDEVVPRPTPTASPRFDSGPLQQRINRLKTELQDADPRQQQLAPPPIDTKLAVP